MAGTSASAPRATAGPLVARRTRGLRAHLVVLALAAAGPALGVGGAAAWHAIGSYREAFEERLQDSARGLALAVDAEINSHLTTLAALAASPLLDRGPAELEAFYVHARRAAEAVHSPVVVVAPDLAQLMTTERPFGEALPGTNAAEAVRAVFNTRRPAVSNLLVGAVSERQLIVVAVPVLRDAHAVLVLLTRLEPERLAGLLAAQVAGSEDTVAALTDARQRVVARSQDHERLLGAAAPPDWNALIPDDKTAGTGPVRSLDGHELIYAQHRLERAPGWRVGVAQPAAAYRASWQRPLLGLGIGGGMVLLAAAAWAAALGRRIILPVDALTRKARDVTRGGGTLQGLPPSGVTEFEALRASIAEAEAALRRGEARFVRALEAARVGAWDWDPTADVMNSSPEREERLTGRAGRSIRNLAALLEAVHPDDRPVVRDAMRRVLERETDDFEAEFRAVWPDGTVRWLRSVGRATADAEGSVREIAGVSMDVTEQVEDARRRETLAREVDHRARNALAVVQSILRLTPADEPKAFAAAVEGRVGALARAHSLLAEEGWSGADLRAVVERELATIPVAPGEVAPFSLDGPQVHLAPAAVQPLTMVLHELATNAARHGALSTPGGAVEVTWRLGRRTGEDGLLHLRWAEQGGPPIPGPPTRRSFGSRFMDSTIRGQLGGVVERSWEPSGLVCEIALPLARILESGR
ncbi:HWE histidine kinase domain-containing protein [Roseomonas chloroacetimidivorans]|uniref:HWE histidine kinase domain-containing protein n=1 Tax=Roseomonas chloroacetimidivorans TaxID=1766656 RepID=UPI003C74A7E8